MIKITPKIDFFPIRKTIRNYSAHKAAQDFKAAINVALLDFPQAMAYALLAGFPVTFGLYASSIASIIGPFFASSRYVVLGATNATAVLILSSFLTLEIAPAEKLIALPILVVLVGLFMVVGAFLKLAGLIRYISRTVITGYITAAAFLIIVNQLGTVIGLKEVKAATFFEVIAANFKGWENAHWESVLVASITFVTYILIKRYLKAVPHIAVTLVLATIFAYFLTFAGIQVEMLDAGTRVNGWPLTLPKPNLELINQMGPIAAVVAFLAILESSSIAKTLAARSGRQLDLNQHLFSMGIANLSSGISSGLPVSGSLTRSMLNYTSGARTVFSSVFSGLLMVAGILLLAPLLGYVPKAALAMIVIFVGISLINIENIRVVIRSTPADATVFFVTFLGGLFFPLTMAICMGAAASIVLFLKRIAEPHLVQYSFNNEGELSAEKQENTGKKSPEISIIHVEGELFFGSTDIFLDQTRMICESPRLQVIILRIRNAHELDATSAMAIKDLLNFMTEHKRTLIVSGANKQVERIFDETGVMEILGEENFFRHTPKNPNLSTREALKRAQEIIGEDKAQINLFSAPHPDAKVLPKEEEENNNKEKPTEASPAS